MPLQALISNALHHASDASTEHGWVNRRIRIYVVLLKDGFYLSTHEIIIFRNHKDDGEKATNEDLKFKEKLHKVLKYSRKFKEE